ncbi:MAG: hypothetical protein JNL97_17020, partial [Verrucomicrobiales bacterium]|nr:hypothetical protein [Verrucomicrobiales bacterium]
VAAAGRIYLASDRGVMTVVAAADELRVLAHADFKEAIMATPALVEDKLYVRSAGRLWAFGENQPNER